MPTPGVRRGGKMEKTWHGADAQVFFVNDNDDHVNDEDVNDYDDDKEDDE